MNNKFYGSLFLILIFLSAPTVFAQSVDGGAAGATDTAGVGEGGEPLVLGPDEAFELAYRHDLSQWQQSRGLALAAEKRRWRYLQPVEKSLIHGRRFRDFFSEQCVGGRSGDANGKDAPNVLGRSLEHHALVARGAAHHGAKPTF